MIDCLIVSPDIEEHALEIGGGIFLRRYNQAVVGQRHSTFTG